MTRDFDDLTLVPGPTEDVASERQLTDYREYRREMLMWFYHVGKDPEQAEGYAFTTVRDAANRIDRFHRWVWDEFAGYTTNVSRDHAGAYLKDLRCTDHSDAHKEKCVRALKMFFKWKEYERGGEPWDPAVTFSSSYNAKNPREFFTREERTRLREAALEYASIPAKSDINSRQKEDEIEAYLAQKYEKPTEEVSVEDWERANGWRIASLVWSSLDAGFRPIEIHHAKPDWIDLDNDVLRIPEEESSKNEDNWVCGVRRQAMKALKRWLQERRENELYSDTDALWLTQRGQRFESSSLKYILDRLCEIAEINQESRQISWYAIRHSVGTYMAREEGLPAAQAQLRHRSAETTIKYDQTPVEDLKNALVKMG